MSINNAGHILRALFSKNLAGGHQTKAELMVSSTLSEIDEIIREKKLAESNESLIKQIKKLGKIIESRAYAIDTLFSPYEGIKEENLEYGVFSPPLIGIFDTTIDQLSDAPILLSEQYVQGLGAENLKELLDAFRAGNVLEKYYTSKSGYKASIELEKVRGLNGYKGLELLTKGARLLSWSSNGFKLGPNKYQIRAGSDNTLGDINEGLDFSNVDKLGIRLDTNLVIDEFREKVLQVIPETIDLVDMLEYFRILAVALDYIWNETHFLMNLKYGGLENLTIPEENPGLLLPNGVIFNGAYQIGYGYDVLGLEKMISNMRDGSFREIAFEKSHGITSDIQGGLHSYVSDFSLKTPNGEARNFPWIRNKSGENGENSLGIATNDIPNDGHTIVQHELSD